LTKKNFIGYIKCVTFIDTETIYKLKNMVAWQKLQDYDLLISLKGMKSTRL